GRGGGVGLPELRLCELTSSPDPSLPSSAIRLAAQDYRCVLALLTGPRSPPQSPRVTVGEYYPALRAGSRWRAAAMTSGTAASLAGAMMWTPATPGMVANSSISSTAMRTPSAAAAAPSPAFSSRSIYVSAMMVP